MSIFFEKVWPDALVLMMTFETFRVTASKPSSKHISINFFFKNLNELKKSTLLF